MYWVYLPAPPRGAESAPLRGRGLLPRSHLAGIHIWFVTSRAGGPIHIKPIGRNPLRGHVDTGAHGTPRSSGFIQQAIIIRAGRQDEGLQHRLPPSEEDHPQGVRQLPYCGLPTLFLIHELQHQRLRQCQPQLSGGAEVPGRTGASAVRHPG